MKYQVALSLSAEHAEDVEYWELTDSCEADTPEQALDDLADEYLDGADTLSVVLTPEVGSAIHATVEKRFGMVSIDIMDDVEDGAVSA